MITMMLGLEPFKAFASAPIENAIITMIPQMNMNAFVQFQIIEPKNLLIFISIFTNDSNIEIVSKKQCIHAHFEVCSFDGFIQKDDLYGESKVAIS